jgi:hypothetical protein
LTENIHFDLSREYVEGLELYFEKAAAAGLIPSARRLEFAWSGGVSTARRGV